MYHGRDVSEHSTDFLAGVTVKRSWVGHACKKEHASYFKGTLNDFLREHEGKREEKRQIKHSSLQSAHSRVGI